ncbi:glycosyltransferase family 1 protein [Microbacterium caowuchunii]|uniref:glycosyltransferase n=1 Tax=Microbacterium caowuchunii TaxID=2614638 RepID=UPI0012460AEF|nr:glycosyltransferase [Microbacterium caowuchunii]QEV99025.1 glycosyltransferase family 1 protein [Microbacterium caowuchunii]
MRRILFLAHSHAFGAFRVGSHHYARTLARAGADVVHLSTPISLAHRVAGRVSADAASSVPRGAHRDADGVTHLVPRTALPRPYGRFRVVRELTRQGIGLEFDAVLIDQPLLWDESVRTLSRRLVYRPTDLYPAGVKTRLQQRILTAADGVVATSSEVLRGLGPLDVPALVLGNGVDAARFAPPADVNADRPPVCVYVGALDARFDWQQVDAWARAHPDVRFAVAGPSAPPPISLPSNVDLLGPVPYPALPALLQGARVGLLPLSDDPLNAGRSPMKLYEYLGAGLATVARETPVIRPDDGAGLYTYRDREGADAVLRRALAHASPNVAGVQRAASESWQAKTDDLTAFLGSLPPA